MTTAVRLFPLLLAAALAGCASVPSLAPRIPAATASATPPAEVPLATVLQTPLYQMTPQEAGRYIAHMQGAEPNLRKRIAAIGRKNLGQPYSLHLLGEFP